MNRFRRYPEYRDSGVEWLGEIPAHWEVVELGSVGAFSTGRGGTKLDEEGQGVPCVRYGDLYTYHDHHIVDTRSYLDQQVAEDYTPITYGDVLFAASGEPLDEIGKSAANLIRSAAVCGGDVIVFGPDGNPDPRFLGYSLGAAHASHQKAIMGHGFTVVHIYIPQLKRLGTLVPPLPEQRAIADFLDRQTSRVDRLVRKKERLIDLLKEKRASLISHAVTRGLDPAVPMRDSGVEWLGEIPAHWGIRPTESFARYDKQAVDPATLDTADKVFHYSIPSIQETGDGTVEPPSQIGSTKSLITGSLLLVSRLNPRKGVVVLATEKSIPTLCSTEFVPLRMNERYDERWAFYEFLSEPVRQRLSGMVQSASRSHQHVDVGHILKMDHPLPPLAEQRAIADFLDHETGQIDALVTKALGVIKLLREYRASVISAAVTGRIDVRDPFATALTRPRQAGRPEATSAPIIPDV